MEKQPKFEIGQTIYTFCLDGPSLVTQLIIKTYIKNSDGKFFYSSTWDLDDDNFINENICFETKSKAYMYLIQRSSDELYHHHKEFVEITLKQMHNED